MSAGAVDVVLSGGGAKTAAHLGAVRALVEAGLVASRYVATSMGAVIAAALAARWRARGDARPAHGRRAARDRAGPARAGVRAVRARPAPGRRRFAGPSRRWCPPAASPSFGCRSRSAVVDLDTGELLLFGAGGADGAAGGRAAAPAALCRCISRRYALRPAVRRRRTPRRAAARGGGRVVTGAGGRGGRRAPGSTCRRWSGGCRAAGGSRARRGGRHADGRPHRGAARAVAGGAGRPPLMYVRPRVERNATFRVDRVRQYAEDGYQAARAALELRPART